MSGLIVVGGQWGDEGKGKIIDILSEKADLVVRSQGGNNAGHTVIALGKEYKFHLIPSGVLYPDVICYITGGVVIDPKALLREIKALEAENIDLKGRLKVSAFAHLILPYHSQLDLLQEKQKGPLAVGTTGKGIGPCYADKANRIGIQFGELFGDFAFFKEHLKQVVSMKNLELVEIFQQDPIDPVIIEKEYKEYIEQLRPYVCFTAEKEIFEALQAKKRVLFEGAHGSCLDQTFGTYPYVTSSSTLASGVAAGAGIGPTQIGHVLAVVKAYTTRVGNGPFFTELTAEEKSLFLSNKEAREVATTTGRFRRMGWFDVPVVKNTLRLNGASSMAIMKLDVLDSLSVIKICVGYELEGAILDTPPAMTSLWPLALPIYEEVEGWKQDTKKIMTYEDLPLQAKAYITRLEKLCNVPISFISYGPEREKTLQILPVF